MEERESRLIRGPQSPDESNIAGLSRGFLMDTSTHLARTQALFTYQLVRLCDGDIRARAEEHIDTLHTWVSRMPESAQLDCAAAELLYTDTAEEDSMPLLPVPTDVANHQTCQRWPTTGSRCP